MNMRLMRLRLMPRILIPLLAAAALCAGAAPAGAKTQTVHLHFQRVATGVDGLYTGAGVRTSGNYVLASLGKLGANRYPSRFLLIDDATAQRTVLRAGGSSTVAAFGTRWILFSRGGRWDLYNIVTRQWRALGAAADVASRARAR